MAGSHDLFLVGAEVDIIIVRGGRDSRRLTLGGALAQHSVFFDGNWLRHRAMSSVMRRVQAYSAEYLHTDAMDYETCFVV